MVITGLSLESITMALIVQKKKRESKELVLISMQLVAILLLRHMYGKTLHNNISPLHAVCKKNGSCIAKSWKLLWDVTSHFPCISAVCVAQEARTQTHGSHQQTLKVLCTKTLSITVWWCKKINCLHNRKPQKKISSLPLALQVCSLKFCSTIQRNFPFTIMTTHSTSEDARRNTDTAAWQWHLIS